MQQSTLYRKVIRYFYHYVYNVQVYRRPGVVVLYMVSPINTIKYQGAVVILPVVIYEVL